MSYRLRGVGQRTKTFDRLGEAQTFQAQTRDPEKARKLRAREKGRVPVADYFTAWVREHNGIRPTTRRRYEDVGRMYVAAYPIGNLNLSDLRREHVKTWIASMEAAGVGRPTIDKAHRTLRACLSEAVRDDKLDVNTASAIATPKADKRDHFYLTAAQVDAVAAQVPERERALLRFLAYTGVRIGEASALRVKHLDLLRRRAVIAENSPELAGRKLDPADTKTERTRIVPLFSDLVDELAEHLDRYGVKDAAGELDRDAFVFTSERGGPVRQNNWRARIFQPAAARAKVVRKRKDGKGMETPRVHDLRHTATSLMAAHGFTLLETSRILGHSTISTTADLYADLFEEVTADKAERFGEALREAAGSIESARK